MSRYVFASWIKDVKAVSKEYGVPAETIEECLDDFFATALDEYIVPVGSKRRLRIVRHRGVVVLQLAEKRGRGYTTTKHPWFFVFCIQEGG
ncbi:hypothetical protein DRO58_08560 [Candidatus Bathyarchaeota archaeon]|mgnify:CR=1 FL=1|nr:MAG: hypothetical protein DRO58_08560 [Candidatus Bathyarchaeota archaeon]